MFITKLNLIANQSNIPNSFIRPHCPCLTHSVISLQMIRHRAWYRWGFPICRKTIIQIEAGTANRRNGGTACNVNFALSFLIIFYLSHRWKISLFLRFAEISTINSVHSKVPTKLTLNESTFWLVTAEIEDWNLQNARSKARWKAVLGYIKRGLFNATMCNNLFLNYCIWRFSLNRYRSYAMTHSLKNGDFVVLQ